MSSMGRRKPFDGAKFIEGCFMMIVIAILIAGGATIALWSFYRYMNWDWYAARPLNDHEFVECLRQHDRDFCNKQTVKKP